MLSNPKILQQVQIPIQENSLCEKAFKKVKMFVSPKQFDESVICAGNLGGAHDSCKGDSGGPMFLPKRNSDNGKFYYHQYGVVSYGKDCGLPDMPALYTRVSHFADWIKKELK